jgi:hypothetical protein
MSGVKATQGEAPDLRLRTMPLALGRLRAMAHEPLDRLSHLSLLKDLDALDLTVALGTGQPWAA